MEIYANYFTTMKSCQTWISIVFILALKQGYSKDAFTSMESDSEKLEAYIVNLQAVVSIIHVATIIEKFRSCFRNL